MTKREGDDEARPSPALPDTAWSASTGHILVVEDSHDMRELLSDLLSAEGYHVTTRDFDRGGVQLIQLIRRSRPDLIILDYLKDGQEVGLRLLRALRSSHDEASSCPIMFCTGANQKINQHRAFLSDIGVEILLKPFEVEDLLAMVRRVGRNPPLPRVVGET